MLGGGFTMRLLVDRGTLILAAIDGGKLVDFKGRRGLEPLAFSVHFLRLMRFGFDLEPKIILKGNLFEFRKRKYKAEKIISN